MLFHLPVYKICARDHLEYPSIFMLGEFFLFQPSPFLQVRLFCLSVQYFLPKIHRKAIISFPDGYACLIDPAVYAGNAEADLAMTELFGGFAPGFYDGYRETNGILPGYSDRRDLYNLYHLLNHLNLFGESYYNEVMRIARRFR